MKSKITQSLEDHFIKLIAAGLILVVFGSYTFYINFSTFSVSESLTATSIVASSVLTFALIAVYWRMSGIQKEQKTVLENQESLMDTQSDILAAEFEPEVIHGEMDLDEQLIRIELRNVGDNVAKYFRLGLDFPNSQAGGTTNAQEISNISWMLKKEGQDSGGYYEWILEVGEEDWFQTELQCPGHPIEPPNFVGGESNQTTVRVYYQYQGRLDSEVYQRALGSRPVSFESPRTVREVMEIVLVDLL